MAMTWRMGYFCIGIQHNKKKLYFLRIKGDCQIKKKVKGFRWEIYNDLIYIHYSGKFMYKDDILWSCLRLISKHRVRVAIIT